MAGLATGPFAMQHFNRVATYGLVANLLVAPISSFLMMPALAIGVVLAPLGLGALPLAAADLAIDTMNRIATTAAGLPGAQLTVASAPGWTLAAAFLGILWLCLCKGPLRWLGLPFALAVAIYPRPPAPDAWIAADGSTVAVRAGEDAVLFRPDAKLFAAELWARRRGLTVPEDGLMARDRAYDCDRWSCAQAPRRRDAEDRRDHDAEALDHRAQAAAVLRLGRSRGGSRRGSPVPRRLDAHPGRLRPRRFRRTLSAAGWLANRLGAGPSRTAPLDAQW
ncbi:MAG: ComEC/Rec2 family competence protein [Phenylobacterium sp.]|uniref:ComEC/Rec2 family competence protein n=1 Tax=Phenylobacterium sp. TaxID=1871053 RepID=UPI002733BBA1|nr:ComEC/Rec2 family competence protein [Phenylobacterium sp.]MDP3745966.1 ComEC/Rec2 family competence protein [Phenylobacterium sp.]